MKPPPFAYEAPEDLAGALERLAAHGWEAKPLAGGQSLVPLLNMRLARPAVLVDLNRVAALEALSVVDGRLRIGALVRHRRLERDPEVARVAPLLAAAARHIGHVAIRTRGTLGGSLAHADPAAELPAAAVALRAELCLRSTRGERWVPARSFFLGTFVTDLAPDEILTEVRVPAAGPGEGYAFLEVARRSGDFALVGVAAHVRLDGDGRPVAAGVALSGVGPAPMAAASVEAALLAGAGRRDVAEAAALVERDIDPPDDLHATRGLRLRIARALTARAIEAAWRSALGGDQHEP